MKKPSTPVIIAIVVLIVAVVVAGLIATDRLVIALKSPDGSVGTRSEVCGSELIAEYNTAFSTESQEQYKERLAAAAGKVNELNDADSDPNCVYIRYTYYIDSEDVDKAREQLDVLKKLAQQGAYVTGELANPQGLDNAERSLTILETSKNPEAGAGEQEPLRGEG